METNKLYHANWLKYAKKLPKASIDLIATDPPYGYSFMGKDWDKVVLSAEYWKACLRVLKPGAFCLVMSAPRQDVLSRAIINLQNAGFETGFTSIYWAYATGFPKAMNISMVVDKQECHRQLTEKLGRAPNKKEFKRAWEGFRKIIGSKKTGADKKPESGIYRLTKKTHQNKSGETVFNITSSTTDAARDLDGSYGGFQPKPAVEVIIVAMKPLDKKTYVDQALANGKGITWLDGCRIPYEGKQDKGASLQKNQGNALKNRGELYGGYGDQDPNWQKDGRFTANLLSSDNILDDGQINTAGSPKGGGSQSGGIWSPSTGQPAGPEYGDSGSFNRYFDLDAWWDERLKNLPKSVKKTFPFLIVPKAAKSEKNRGLESSEKKRSNYRPNDSDQNTIRERLHNSIAKANHHPTVKPVKLMAYLITLASRRNDTVLDPFCGSGTTCIAAEMLGRKWIGVEKNKDYHKIAIDRMKAETYQHKIEFEL